MKKTNISLIAFAVSLAFSAGAMAQTMTKDEYKTQKNGIAADYKSGKAKCGSFAGNAKDICMAEAAGLEHMAKADLENRYKPGQNAQYQVRAAKAEAEYSVAMEKCDDKAGNAKDVCVKEAKSAQTSAKADAKAQLKTADANKVANDKSTKAYSEADKKAVDARGDASEAKNNAAFAVAKEKCDALASDAKDSCLTDAKARFGKS